MDLPPLTLELILWLGVPPAASLAVLIAGLYVRRRSARLVLVWLGLLGVILSILWFLLVLRVEAVVK